MSTLGRKKYYFSLLALALVAFFSLSLIPLRGLLDRGRLGTDGTARAKVGLHSLCRVVTDEDIVKIANKFALSLGSPYLCSIKQNADE